MYRFGLWILDSLQFSVDTGFPWNSTAFDCSLGSQFYDGRGLLFLAETLEILEFSNLLSYVALKMAQQGLVARSFCDFRNFNLS